MANYLLAIFMQREKYFCFFFNPIMSKHLSDAQKRKINKRKEEYKSMSQQFDKWLKKETLENNVYARGQI